MKKIITISLIVFLFTLGITGCSKGQVKDNNSRDDKIVNVLVPDGLPAIAICKLIKEDPLIKEGYKVKYTIEKNTESLSTSVMKGEADIAIVPSNMAAISYNKTKKYKIAGTVGWGSFYLSTITENKELSDLNGKEIYNIGKGLTPDIITKNILSSKGFNIDNDLKFNYVKGASELAPIILSNKAQYAVIPEPVLSMIESKNKNIKTILNLNEEWIKKTNSKYGYPQSTLIIKQDMLTNDSEFIEKFLDEVDNSSEWIYKDKDSLGEYSEEIGVSANKDIVIKSIEKSNINFTNINDCYNDYKIYFETLYKFDKKTLGGNLPDDEIFMQK